MYSANSMARFSDWLIATVLTRHDPIMVSQPLFIVNHDPADCLGEQFQGLPLLL